MSSAMPGIDCHHPKKGAASHDSFESFCDSTSFRDSLVEDNHIEHTVEEAARLAGSAVSSYFSFCSLPSIIQPFQLLQQRTAHSINVTINTDKRIVGEALLDVKLIAGEEGDYGMYIKTGNGITADYDTDGTYWGFFIDGEYAMSGVDTTEIESGVTYSLVVSK